MNARYVDSLRLEKLRVERDMTIKALAEESGLSYSFVKCVRRGERRVSALSAARLAHALGVDVEDFIAVDAEGDAQTGTEMVA